MNSPKKVAGGGSRLRRDVASLRSNSNHPITQKRRCPGQAEALRFVAGGGFEPSTCGL